MLHRQVVPKVKELIQDTSQTLTLLVTQHGDKTLCEPTLLRAFAKGLQPRSPTCWHMRARAKQKLHAMATT